MKKFLKFALIAFVAITVIGMIGAAFSDKKEKKETIAAPATSSKSEPITPALPVEGYAVATKWRYIEDVDKMTSKKSYIATIASDNTANFEFPYNGGSTFELAIRAGKYNDVYIGVSKGQFTTSYNGDKQISLRFDDEKPMYVGFSGASDGSSDVIFPEGKSKIIAKLKKAKKLLVEAEFYREGNVVMEFDVSGFEWKH